MILISLDKKTAQKGIFAMPPKGLLLFCAFYLQFLQLSAWGFEPHRRINQQACLILPAPLFGFYKSHINYMMQHATDPDMRRYVDTLEAGRHFIDMEHFGGDMDSLPMNYYEALEKYGVQHLQHEGNLPWNIIRNVFLLKQAFSEQNTDFILKISADLGHYLADAHVPLHTTANYNGQLTGQNGIHGLWETEVPKLFMDTLLVPMPHFEYNENWTSWIWDCIKESNQQVNTVLKAEMNVRHQIPEKEWYGFRQEKNGVKKTYSDAYLTAYHNQLNGMVDQRFIASAQVLAQLIYSAWIMAGEPPLEAHHSTKPETESSKNANSLPATELDCNH